MLTPKFTGEAVAKVMESYRAFAWFQFLNTVNSRMYHLTYKPQVYFKHLISKIEDEYILDYLGTFKIIRVGNDSAMVSFRQEVLLGKKKVEVGNEPDI